MGSTVRGDLRVPLYLSPGVPGESRGKEEAATPASPGAPRGRCPCSGAPMHSHRQELRQVPLVGVFCPGPLFPVQTSPDPLAIPPAPWAH